MYLVFKTSHRQVDYFYFRRRFVAEFFPNIVFECQSKIKNAVKSTFLATITIDKSLKNAAGRSRTCTRINRTTT